MDLSRQFLLHAQLPLIDLVVGYEVDHVLLGRAEIVIIVGHGLFGALRRLCYVSGRRKVRVWARGRRTCLLSYWPLDVR
jgi:hypothetical protein